MGATMERVSIGGAELEFVDQGSGEPVVLIHGAGPADSFLPLALQPPLRDHYRVIRYHRRGSAGSSAVHGPFAIAQHAADCRALMDALNISQAHVVGHSFGGYVALQLAADAPAVVHTLGLFDVGLVTDSNAEQFGALLGPLVAQYTAGDRVGAAHAYLEFADGPDWRAEIDRTVPGGVEQAERDVATFYECELPAMGEWRFGPEDGARITQPAFFLLGSESDPIFAESRDLLRAWLAQMEDDVLPGANHLMHMRDPSGAATRLVDFLHRHPLSL
jgi:pimeloyl-ACP methyl ester carboxylesterase